MKTRGTQPITAAESIAKYGIFTGVGAVLVLTILAALLRFVHLGRESLWFDEAFTVALVRLDSAAFWSIIRRSEANMSLYFNLLRIWITVGDSEFALRSLSALFGLSTIPALYFLGRRMFTARVGIIGALLLAVNPFHIQYSQEVRGYTLVALLVTLSSLFFIRAIEDNRRVDWAAYVITTILAAYSHFFGVLILGAHAVSLVALRPTAIPWRSLVVSLAVIGVFLTPLTIFVATTKNGPDPGVLPKPGRHEIYLIFNALVGTGFVMYGYLVLSAVACAAALVAYLRQESVVTPWRYSVLLSWVFAPIAAAFVVSLRTPLMVERYFIVCLPGLLLLAAVGASQIRPAWLQTVSVATLLILTMRVVFWNYSHLQKENWRDATASLMSRARPQDGVLLYVPGGRFGFDYYVGRMKTGHSMPKIVFPDPWGWEGSEFKDDPDDTLVQLLPQRYERVWLVLSHNELTPGRRRMTRSLESILSDYPEVTRTVFNGVQVTLFSGREPTPGR